jgi:Holliday junction resolvasome RuvABC endonuclease subunit
VRTILGVDPGGTTGFAQITVEESEIVHFEMWQRGDLLEVFDDVSNALVSATEVVAERFQGPVRDRFFDLAPAEVIGVIKLAALEQKTPVHWQTASQVKNYFNDKRLREFGVYTRGMPHGNDAMRHALYYSRIWVATGAGL